MKRQAPTDRLAADRRVGGKLGGCQGKVAFGTFELANRAVSRRGCRVEDPRRPYHCPHCRQWHVGGSEPTKRHKRLRDLIRGRDTSRLDDEEIAHELPAA